MSSYFVTISYATLGHAEVIASSEKEAIDLAREAITNEELLDNLQENRDPEVVLL